MRIDRDDKTQDGEVPLSPSPSREANGTVKKYGALKVVAPGGGPISQEPPGRGHSPGLLSKKLGGIDGFDGAASESAPTAVT